MRYAAQAAALWGMLAHETELEQGWNKAVSSAAARQRGLLPWRHPEGQGWPSAPTGEPILCPRLRAAMTASDNQHPVPCSACISPSCTCREHQGAQIMSGGQAFRAAAARARAHTVQRKKRQPVLGSVRGGKGGAVVPRPSHKQEQTGDKGAERRARGQGTSGLAPVGPRGGRDSAGR